MRLSEYTRWLDKNPCDEVAGYRYCMNLYTLADGIQAKRVLEIGTGWGCSTAAFAASLSNRPGSRIVTVDCEDRLEPKCKKLIDKTGVPVEYVSSRFEDYVLDGPVDLIYCDTDWTRESMQACKDRFYDMLVDGGLFIIDGVFGQIGPTTYVRDSGLSFVPLQYCDAYAHGVHRKPPWPYPARATFAHCRECAWSSPDWDEDMALASGTDHAGHTGHRVLVGGMVIGRAA